jgi:hypothetical protein
MFLFEYTKVNEKGAAKRERRSTQPHDYRHALSGINCFCFEKNYLYDYTPA